MTIIREEIIGGQRLILGDCREVLPLLERVDAVVTDPPYWQTSLEWDKWVPGWMDRVGDCLSQTGSVWVFGSLRMFTERWGEFA